MEWKMNNVSKAIVMLFKSWPDSSLCFFMSPKICVIKMLWVIIWKNKYVFPYKLVSLLPLYNKNYIDDL